MTDRFVQARNNYCETWYTLDNFKILTILNLVETRDTDNDSFNLRLTLWSSEYTLHVYWWDFTETREIQCDNIVT